MRSTFMQPSGATSEAGDSDAPFYAYWWRSLQDFDAGDVGRPEQLLPSSYSSRAAAALPARLRVVRELERLALFANESLDELRHKLLTYKAGDLWFPAGGIPKQETDIPPVITILLVGFAGTGKSSLINLMYSVLGRAGFVPFAQTACPAGRDGRTMYLEEHNVLRSMNNGFCVFDSRGMDYDRVHDGLAEVEEWMEEGVRHRQPCRGAGIPLPSSTSSSSSASSSSAAAKRFIRRRVNCPIVVASLSELYSALGSGDFCALQATRDLVHSPYIKTSCTENPILLLTHGDELTPEDRIAGRVKICEYLGVSETSDVYDVPCLNEYGAAVDEMDPVTSYAVAEAVYRALVVADRTHPPKPSMKEWVVLLLSWSMCVLSAMFAFLSACCSKVANANNKDHNKFRSHWHK